MAEGVLFSVAELLIETLGSAAINEISQLWHVGDKFVQLQRTLQAIRAVILDAEKKKTINHQVSLWLERLEEVVSEVDDLLDQVTTEGLLAIRRNWCARKVKALNFQPKLAHEIKRIQMTLDEITIDRNRFFLEEGFEQVTRLEELTRSRETHSSAVEEDVIGRENDKRAIMELLMNPNGRVLSVVPIVGMGGIGKTTLSQLIFNDARVVQHFDFKSWVCVSDNFNERLLIEKIAESVTGELTKHCTVEHLQTTLQKKINEKRYLLVLDDVWSESREKWLGLKTLLSNCGAESRILVTTRSLTVAKIMGTVEPYNLAVLDPEKAWSLFERVAFNENINNKPRDKEITKIAEEIVKKCGGVPLAINMIGSVLFFRGQEVGQWQNFQRELSNIVPQEENSVFRTLKLSYDHLPCHLKHCFSFCALFPQDKEIDVQTLVLMWIAQGFVQSSGRSESLEDIGYEYFLQLLWRSFFQEVQRDDINNCIVTCKMHDLLHDLAVQVAGRKFAKLGSGEDNIDSKVRHLSLSFYEIPCLSLRAKRLRTIILSNKTYLEDKYGEAICEVICSNFKFIRMLDLSNSEIEMVPCSIGKLKHLRYLDLTRNESLKKLPPSITKLVNLHTLKLSGCWELRELPMDIGNLVSLRHLELPISGSKMSQTPRGLSQLTNLRTLSRFDVGEDSSGGNLDGLARLNMLRGKLLIKGLGRGTETKPANLIQKEDLRSLHLRWRGFGCDITNPDRETGYEGLQPHPSLAELKIVYCSSVRLPNWFSSLTNLVHLLLAGCKCRIFPSLDRLCVLKKMQILQCCSLKYIPTSVDNHDHCLTPILPSLQQLKLSGLLSFKGWQFESGIRENHDSSVNQAADFSTQYFPGLIKLTIENCPDLSIMPIYPKVEDLILVNTSEKPFELTASTRAMLSQPLSPLSKVKHLVIHLTSDPALLLLPIWMVNISSLEMVNIYWSTELPDYLKFQLHHSRLMWNDCCDRETSERDWSPWECFTCLSQLCCEGLPSLECLSPAIRYFTSLQNLQIVNCRELEIAEDSSSNCPSSFESLTCLQIVALEQVAEVPSWLLRVPGLEELQFEHCPYLTVIPDWIGELGSLKRLRIIRCPMLESLPGSIARIESLQSLQIKRCPFLFNRCRSPTGQDWPKIEHIAELEIYS